MKKTAYITQGAVIAAAYFALCMLVAPIIRTHSISGIRGFNATSADSSRCPVSSLAVCS